MFAAIKDKIFADLGLEDVNAGLYDGDWVSTDGRSTLDVISPINGEKLAAVALAGEDDYNIVIEKAWQSYQVWSKIPAPQRGSIIREIGDEISKYKETLGLLVSLEVGKTRVEGMGEVQEMIDIGDFAVGLSRQLYGVTIASERPNHRLYEQWHPYGVVGVITAFNFPCAVWSWNALIAAVIGNVVVWKPSPNASLTAIATNRICSRVLERHGLPPIFFLMVDEGRTLGEKLAKDVHVPLLSFTGSIRTGRQVAQNVASRLGRSILELGGNNAAIVSDKVDMEIALRGVAFGAMATAGQRCTSTRRLILHEGIYDEFVEKLTNIYKKVKVGNPLEEGVLVGPLINQRAVDAYRAAIQRAVDEGGTVLCGDEVVQPAGCEDGFYVRPTLIEGSPSMGIVCEETFAPILYVLKYSTLDEALQIHNGVMQGLSSSIFTTDLRESEAFLSLHGSDCGLANVNTGTAGAEIGGAFGGEKETGGGRESGSDAWKAYARRQTVTINYGDTLPLAQGVRFDV
ncbi:aldehyde dehydrogenase family protein [bacterium]|nr:aldehyde dehydrogenase family protein [bacterium]